MYADNPTMPMIFNGSSSNTTTNNYNQHCLHADSLCTTYCVARYWLILPTQGFHLHPTVHTQGCTPLRTNAQLAASGTSGVV
jgi:hypothetical protein